LTSVSEIADGLEQAAWYHAGVETETNFATMLILFTGKRGGRFRRQFERGITTFWREHVQFCTSEIPATSLHLVGHVSLLYKISDDLTRPNILCKMFVSLSESSRLVPGQRAASGVGESTAFTLFFRAEKW
jgi:hypothetical protein